MDGVLKYLVVALGVFISVVLPLIRAALPKPKPEDKDAPSWWTVAKPYLLLGVFSLIVALLIVAFMGDIIKDWEAALLAGYTADSTLQKLSTGNNAPSRLRLIDKG